MICLRQAEGENLQLSSPPERIVSLVPSITENLILFGKKPVGRTSFCIYPKEEVRRVRVIGGTKTPKLSRIVELNPDLVIANKEENRREDIESLQKQGIPVWVTYVARVKEALSLMETLEELCDRREISRPLLQSCREKVNQIVCQKPPKKVSVLTLIWKNPWMSVGQETYIHDMIETAGGKNVILKRSSRYPELEEKELLALCPDVVILPSEPYAFGPEDQRELSAGFKSVGKLSRIELFSGEDLSWYGPRLAEGLEKLSSLFCRVLQ